jgi:hypothetical protein
MAGDWIKMRADLLTHPKVVRIVSALQADKLRVIGGLHAVWCLFDAHSIDGTLDGYTSSALDDYIGWPGFCAAMIKVGWLEENGESLATPRFDEHNGQSAKRRATETQRKRIARDVPEMSALVADKKRSREEKRREEINTTPNGVVATKRPAKKCPVDFKVTSEMREWAKAECPNVDVDRATAKFRDHTFKNAITDWPATWRNWLRNDFERATSVASKSNASKYAGAAKAIWGDDESRTINA